MPIQRIFLDWNQPALSLAVDFFVQRCDSSRVLDLSNVWIVVPGSQAGRRLKDLLLKSVEASRLVYYPPEIITVGQLPERLYEPELPFANPITQQLAWAKSLQSLSSEELRNIISNPPTSADDSRWIELGILLQKQHRELAGDGLNFRSVLECGENLESFLESDRWEALAKAQEKYLATLDDLQLWDRQTARLVAIEQQECQTQREIVLVSMADMNTVMRKILDQVQHQTTSLIYAPESLHDRFDEYGCIIASQWQNVSVPIQSDHICYVDSMADQGTAVVQMIGDFDQRFAADEITIGIPDESLIPFVEVALEKANLKGRWGPGVSVEASRPIRLLRSLCDYVNELDFENLAELVRHPDIGRWIRKSHIDEDEFLVDLDTFLREHVPASVAKKMPSKLRSSHVLQVKRLLDHLVAPFIGEERTPGEWVPCIMDFVQTIYGDLVIDLKDDSGRMTLAACDAVRDSLEQLRDIPSELESHVPSHRAILMALSHIQNQRSPDASLPDRLEMQGWLELHLDDAPAAIVTNFNDNCIPASIDSDLFLPNALRTELGIDDNRRLYARDVYAANLIKASHREFRVIVGRRNSNGDPILPSRLLFATSNENVLSRSLKLFDEQTDQWSDPSDEDLREHHAFAVPRPQPRTQPMDTIRVTDFRAYLACPYRFYLAHVLLLEHQPDRIVEMDGSAFGRMLHTVLEDFGRESIRHSKNPDEIQTFLHRCLKYHEKELYGSNTRAAIRIQIEQMRLRLQAFAHVEAKRRADGWKIMEIEQQYETQFYVDNRPIRLIGRIDRIDHHARTGQYALLDYKSSDNGTPPHKTHVRAGEWVDLQLPLYRHLIKDQLPHDDLILGYMQLPKDVSAVKIAEAAWTHEEFARADEVARNVVRRIRNQEFWQPVYPPPEFADTTAPICQDTVFDRRLELAQSGSATTEGAST